MPANVFVFKRGKGCNAFQTGAKIYLICEKNILELGLFIKKKKKKWLRNDGF